MFAFSIRFKIRSLFRATAYLLIPALLSLLAAGCGPKSEATDSADKTGASDSSSSDKKSPTEIKLSDAAVQQYHIVVGLAQKSLLLPTINTPARVSFNLEAIAHVGSVLRGRVIDVKVRMGDLVAKGDVLLVVESPELGESQSDFLQKKTTMETAVPAADLAENAYDRAKSLYDQSQGIALTDLQKRESDFRAAQGALSSAKSGYVAAENKLHLLGMDQKAVETLAATGEIAPKFSITSPLAGQIVQREVTLGELVSPDKEALLVVADTTTLWILADVPEAELPGIQRGAKARIKVSGNGDTATEGTVALVEPTLDPTTRTCRVRVDVKNTTAALRPGMFAQAEITTAPLDGKSSQLVLVVPEEAIQTVDGTTAIFVPSKGSQNTFLKRAVVTSKAVNGMVPVLSGLSENESVVTSGSFILKAELGKSSAEE